MQIAQPQRERILDVWGHHDVFSKIELETLLEDVKALPETVATINPGESKEDKSYLSSSIRWIPEQFKWVYDRLIQVAVGANQGLWDYDITHNNDLIQYTEYYATEGGKYDWHLDAGNGITSQRKLSVCVQLNDDYEGGEFEVLLSKQPTEQPKKANFATVFPGWMLHRVKPVTMGTRKSLVLWVCGPPLR